MAVAKSSVVSIEQLPSFQISLFFHLWNKEFDLKKTAGVFHEVLFIGRIRLFIFFIVWGLSD